MVKEKYCEYCRKRIIHISNNRQKYHKECRKIGYKIYKEKYDQRPEIKLNMREYQRKYSQRLEVKARRKAHSQRPEVQARIKAYYHRPEVKARRRVYNQRPEAKARQRELKRQKEKEFVKINTPDGRVERVYADGAAQEIQKEVPEITHKIMKKMLE